MKITCKFYPDHNGSDDDSTYQFTAPSFTEAQMQLGAMERVVEKDEAARILKEETTDL